MGTYNKLKMKNIGPCNILWKFDAGMILGAKFRSWANFPWFFQKRDSLF
jgi:hypothetical protein